MTARFRAKETQTGFAGWVRNNPRLESIQQGIVVVDSDLWIHRYKSVAGRSYQFVMLVEVKEFGAVVSEYQRDTLHIINQLLRNRRNTKPEWNAIDDGARLTECYSLSSNSRVRVLCFGAHVLRLSGDGTFCHWNALQWDNKPVSSEQLESILLFELDPDTLGKLDHRPNGRHKEVESVVIERTPLDFTVERLVKKRS